MEVAYPTGYVQSSVNSILLQYDKNGRELYYDLSSGKKVRIAKSQIGTRPVIKDQQLKPIKSQSANKRPSTTDRKTVSKRPVRPTRSHPRTVPNQPQTQIEMVVFDFDCTITAVHSCMSPAPSLNKLMTSTDKEAFKKLINKLLSNGIKPSIASYGRKAVILQLMGEIFSKNNPFTSSNVITPQDISRHWPECSNPPDVGKMNKNNMMDLLRKRFNPTSMTLIDDDIQNVTRAIQAGYNAVQVSSCAGMTKIAPQIVDLFLQSIPQNPRYLRGPVSIYYMKHPSFPYKICLLGDFHDKLKTPCSQSINVGDWIYNMVQSGLNLDLYFEFLYTTKEKGLAYPNAILNGALIDTYMYDVFRKFEVGCFHHTKVGCQIKNTRLHYVDLRRVILEKVPIYITVMEWYDATVRVRNAIIRGKPGSFWYPVEQMKRVLKQDMKMLEKMTDPKQLQSLLKIEFVQNKINKQLANFPPERKYMADMIRQTLNNIEQDFFANAPRITSKQLNMLQKFVSGRSKSAKEMEKILVPFALLIYDYYIIHGKVYGDIYAVARMLRTYPKGRSSYNSLAYMGNAHIEFIRDLLLHLGFNIEYQQYSSSQCLDIGGLKLFN